LISLKSGFMNSSTRFCCVAVMSGKLAAMRFRDRF
jgi:hypothetical protein